MSQLDHNNPRPAPADAPRLILFLGAKWWGSDSRALAMALRRLGHILIEVDAEDYVPVQWSSPALRIARRALSPWSVREYNRVIRRHAENPGLDFMLVFKGKHLAPQTLATFVNTGRPAYCMYPDVSFLDHGPDIWNCLPLYDCLFTTKSYHLQDSRLRERIRRLELVSHGFDPEVHRPVAVGRADSPAYSCDVSFVGCWSPKKQRILADLLARLPGLDLRIWGNGWARASQGLVTFWQGRGAFGDELSLIYRCSRINLGLLSEAGGGSTVGDQVTARTWQIPATGGFLLHEATAELERYFSPGREVAVFASSEELAEQTARYLSDEPQRSAVAAAGHDRCLRSGYTYLGAAQQILDFHAALRAPAPAIPPRPQAAPGRGSAPAAAEFPGLDQRPLSILFVGPLVPGGTAAQRLEAFKSLGHATTPVTTRLGGPYTGENPPLLRRVRTRLLGPADLAGANEQILARVRETSFDIVWVEKGLSITPATLRGIHEAQPACRLAGFSPDDMSNPANQSHHFLAGLPLYDCFVTNKSFNVAELKDMGCAQVLFVDNGFDPATHRPMDLTPETRRRLGGPVGFIGQWEPERANSLRLLARAGMPVRVWGYTWERMRDIPPTLTLENRPLWGDDYARALCAFDINLCFLRKCNRDRQTTRSIEIPACGAFMLAERTDEHLQLFAEGAEAEFFSDDQELLQKVRHYLAHPEERFRVARQGLQRCLQSAYSYRERLRDVLLRLRKSPIMRAEQ